MQTEQYCISKIKEQGVLPLFYNDDAAVCIAIVKTLYNAGIRVIEFTNRGNQALSNLQTVLRPDSLNATMAMKPRSKTVSAELNDLC